MGERMKPRISLRQALTDPQLLGAVLAGPSWATWRAVLIGAMGESLEPDEVEAFVKVTGRQPPTQRCDELWCCIGRRGGKSRAMAALAIYLAGLCDYTDTLDRGEVGVVLLLAPDMRQSKVLLDYAEGALSATPMMKQLLAGRTSEMLTLSNGIRLEVRSASFRRIRGMTCVAVLGDEIAFWRSDESANPDVEILNAARPALATTGGPLIAISSPYARRGALWETFRRDYGPEGDPAILVAHGPSMTFNPELPQSVIDRAMARDEPAARAEYLAEFRTDVETFLAREVIDACIKPGVRERAPERKHGYVAFIDPSGGSSDSMTLAIAHAEGSTQILDLIRERKPPFSPEAVVQEFAGILRQYRCSSAYGDKYGGEWPAEAFRKVGVNYTSDDTPTKSEIYVDTLPMLNSGAVDLLDSDRLVHQLLGLERRTARSGKDSIDHGPGGHDDVANAVAGALVMCARGPVGAEWFSGPAVNRKLAEAATRYAKTIA
jgi:hypothetical protein